MRFSSDNIIKILYTADTDCFKNAQNRKYTQNQIFYIFFKAYFLNKTPDEISDENGVAKFPPIDRSNAHKYLLGKLAIPQDIKRFYLEDYNLQAYDYFLLGTL